MEKMMESDTKAIKTRVEAILIQSRLNAERSGGDASNAAMEILMAFILASEEYKGGPDNALALAWPHAMAAVDNFWPRRVMHS